jgi:outer membrane protein assembly factor BamB
MTTNRLFSVVVALLISVSNRIQAQEAAPPLPWTSTDGRVIQAKFVKMNGTTVIMEKDGKQFQVPFSKLSTESIEQAKKLNTPGVSALPQLTQSKPDRREDSKGDKDLVNLDDAAHKARTGTGLAEWPQWRGPDRNGVAAESPPLANRWPPKGPKRLWQAEQLMNDGQPTGHSSPVVAGGCVFLYGNWLTNRAAMDAVICLDAKSGRRRWCEKFLADSEGEVRCQGSTPCVSGNRVYVAGRKQVYCLDATNGRLLWKQPVDSPHDGLGSSLAVVDGVAILICQGMYGFDALTGQPLWRHKEPPGDWNKKGAWGAYPSPVCWRRDGKNYVICGCRSVDLVDPTNGKILWSLPWVEGGWSSWSGNSTPAVSGDQMVLMQKNGGMECYTLALEAPRKLWHLPDHDVATSPLIYKGNVYTIGGGDYAKDTSIRCANLQTGAVAWENPNIPPQGCSSPIAADGKIFGFLKFGRLLGMWKADASGLIELGMAPVKADGYSSLALADGHLFVRLADGVACYDLTDH